MVQRARALLEIAEQIAVCGASIVVTGFNDDSGHTEYLIATQLVVRGETWHARQRVSGCRALHKSIQPALALPKFPIPKLLFHSEAVKSERAGALQAYLRQAAAAAKCTSGGMPVALCDFLHLTLNR